VLSTKTIITVKKMNTLNEVKPDDLVGKKIQAVFGGEGYSTDLRIFTEDTEYRFCHQMSVMHYYSEHSLAFIEDAIITEFESVEDLEELGFCNDHNNEIGLDVIAIYRLKTDDDAEFMLTFSRIVSHEDMTDAIIAYRGVATKVIRVAYNNELSSEQLAESFESNSFATHLMTSECFEYDISENKRILTAFLRSYV